MLELLARIALPATAFTMATAAFAWPALRLYRQTGLFVLTAGRNREGVELFVHVLFVVGLDAEWFEGRMGLEIGAAKRNEPGARLAYQQAYRAVVEDTDLRIGEVLEALGQHREDTLIVLTSDHGELLGEHGVVGHGYWVYEPLTSVPYLVSGARTELPEFVSNAATAQLLCDELGVDHTFSVSLETTPIVSQREGKLALSEDGRYKAIWDPSPKAKAAFGVFDLEHDPEELVPLAVDHDLRASREAWERAMTEATPLVERVELSEETSEELKKLGYIE